MKVRTWQKRASALHAVVLALLSGVLYSLVGPRILAAPEGLDGRNKVERQFVGSSQCRACHAAEHAEWSASQHEKALQEATENSVLGDFDNAQFEKDGVVSTFFKRGNEFWVRTDGPDGTLADFQISYTIGIAPLQQYLIKVKRGRLQALGIAWDARPRSEGGQRWYAINADRKISAGDPLHWTGIDQIWNYQCAWCHSTNLKKNYNSATDEFKTSWSEISVGCEACHGPASNHIAWATRSPGWDAHNAAKGFAKTFDERRNVSWQMDAAGQARRSSPRKTSKEIETCAQCHSRRQQYSSNAADVLVFFDAFRPSTIEADLYYSDGQQREEVYTYASFVQSRMHAAGVTCADCHNPHSGKLRQPGNKVCSQCHAEERFDSPGHHHHSVTSSGSKCVSCHMPTTTYMGVDARHDHSLRVPRPDRSVAIGTPNACNQCHAEKSPTWAVDAIRAWGASPNPGAQNFAEAFDLGDKGAPGAQAALRRIVSAQSSSSIAKASALARLAQFPSASSLDEAIKSLKSKNPLVRMSAVFIIAGSDDGRRRELLFPLLADPSRLVRINAARALADTPDNSLTPDEKSKLEKALSEYVDAQNFNAERPEALTNLGIFYGDRGRIDDARRAFERAIAIDPNFVAAAISLADLTRRAGGEATAEQILRQSLNANPRSGPLEHALGLSLIRQKRIAEGIASLIAAAHDSPDDAHFSYVLGVALHDIGKPVEALETLKSALVRHPYDREILWGLASYEAERQDFASAIARLSLLSELEPQRQDISNALAALRRAAEPR